ncbi:hypothetical protein [uncultured Halomonas sp.]|uniref:hypothetical protein n=1 Tax=uncultured Halomonas sp. TaxID=173971 RepID=UPI002619A753|nr:hypothetical protein [uncultured Halomonas sp.]
MSDARKVEVMSDLADMVGQMLEDHSVLTRVMDAAAKGNIEFAVEDGCLVLNVYEEKIDGKDVEEAPEPEDDGAPVPEPSAQDELNHAVREFVKCLDCEDDDGDDELCYLIFKMKALAMVKAYKALEGENRRPV